MPLMNNELGSVYISDDVIGMIAGISATECYGLVGMAAKGGADGFFELIKGENLSKGVKVSSNEGRLIIDLYIIVEFGTKISVVAQNIMSKVKYNVEHLTGTSVSRVNVNVQGVRVERS